MDEFFLSHGIVEEIWINPLLTRRLETGVKISNKFMHKLVVMHKESGQPFSVFYDVLNQQLPLEIKEKISNINIKSFQVKIARFHDKVQKAKKNAKEVKKYF